jgi:hypothetical protein
MRLITTLSNDRHVGSRRGDLSSRPKSLPFATTGDQVGRPCIDSNAQPRKRPKCHCALHVHCLQPAMPNARL